MEEAKLSKWLVTEGSKVRPNTVICEIETDKATMEVEATEEGIIDKILVAAGTENIKVNTIIASLAVAKTEAIDIANLALTQLHLAFTPDLERTVAKMLYEMGPADRTHKIDDLVLITEQQEILIAELPEHVVPSVTRQQQKVQLTKLLTSNDFLASAIKGFWRLRDKHNFLVRDRETLTSRPATELGLMNHMALYFDQWVLTIGIVWPPHGIGSGDEDEWIAIVAITKSRLSYRYKPVSDQLNEIIDAVRKLAS